MVKWVLTEICGKTFEGFGWNFTSLTPEWTPMFFHFQVLSSPKTRQNTNWIFSKPQLCSLLLKILPDRPTGFGQKRLSFPYKYQRRMSSYLLTRPAEEGLSTLHHHTDSWIKHAEGLDLTAHCYLVLLFLHIVMSIYNKRRGHYCYPTTAKNYGSACVSSWLPQAWIYIKWSLLLYPKP